MNTMSKTKQVFFILLSFSVIIFLPLIGSSLYHKGHFPEHFFQYPMTAPIKKLPFSWAVFGFIAAGGLVTICLYFFPQWFGFKRTPTPPAPHVRKVKWPWWFWAGIIAFGSCIALLWTKSSGPVLFLHWSDFPLFWGLALSIDGWVYVRNGGRSMVSDRPQELIGIGVSSAMGWMLFEYLNFFVDYDWFYPFGDQISNEQFLFYAIVISTGLLPLAFVFYDLFNTVPVLKTRFTEGPKYIMPEKVKTILLVLSTGSLFAAGLSPDKLFFVLWISPAILIAVVLDKLGIWTPLRSIGKGNWRPVLVFALTYLAAGLCLECENYFSAARINGVAIYSEQPAFWQYNLPYISRFHLFEMPILGFFGYMPFGIYCWVWWIAFAYMQGIPSMLFQEKPLDPIIDDK
jgi:hypothetical protein